MQPQNLTLRLKRVRRSKGFFFGAQLPGAWYQILTPIPWIAQSAQKGRGVMGCHTREQCSVQSWVDKYRTGSGSDRVEHPTGLVLLHFLRRLEFDVESLTRSLPLPVLNLSTHWKTFPYRFRLRAVPIHFLRKVDRVR